MVEEAQAEAAKPRDVESASVTELAPRMLLTDDQKETAVEGNEVAHGEDNEEPLPPMKKARARKTTEEKSRLRKKGAAGAESCSGRCSGGCS